MSLFSGHRDPADIRQLIPMSRRGPAEEVCQVGGRRTGIRWRRQNILIHARLWGTTGPAHRGLCYFEVRKNIDQHNCHFKNSY